jgi:hypothetical protein
MKGLPFSAEMTHAWHEGRKTVTRRLVKPQPRFIPLGRWAWDIPKSKIHPGCTTTVTTGSREWWEYLTPEQYPYQPGEIVYVQEPWRRWFPIDDAGQPLTGHWLVRYACDNAEIETDVEWDEGPDYTRPDDIGVDVEPEGWLPPALMPEWASRSKARIVDVRVERVQEITEKEINAEGMACSDCWTEGTPYRDFPHPEHCGCRSLWINCFNALYPGSWKRNDWVFVYGLEKVELASIKSGSTRNMASTGSGFDPNLII